MNDGRMPDLEQARRATAPFLEASGVTKSFGGALRAGLGLVPEERRTEGCC